MKIPYEKFSGLNLLTLATSIVIILSSSYGVKAQIYTTDFESFTVGQKVACEDPANWTTWSNAPCGAEDAMISADFAHSGVNSVKDNGSNDLVLLMGDKTTGKYQLEFWMYIPKGKGGYYNLLQNFAGSSSKWGLEFVFTDAGTANLLAGGQTIPVAYTHDQWFKVTNIIDLVNNRAEVLLGGVSVHSWQWSLGALGSGGLNQLAAANFYPGTGASGIISPLYYFDDVEYIDISEPPVAPTLTTTSVFNITLNNATSGGTVTSDGGAIVTARGVCWSLTASPTIADTKTADGSGIGTFTSSIFGLMTNTTYYVRAYATNSVGTGYGNKVSFTTLNETSRPCPGTPSVSYGGQTYNTVLIGSQCWLKENLNIGTRINGSVNQTNNGIIEKYCYDDLESNCNIYGGLYQWDEMMQYITNAGAQGICPVGWHIPTDYEYCILTLYLDPMVDCNIFGVSGTTAGGKMKETTTSYWTPPNTGATNESGFTARPGGGWNKGSYAYQQIGTSGIFQVSTQNTNSYSLNRFLMSGSAGILRHNYNKDYGFSLRCLKDPDISTSTPTVTTTSASNITQTTATSGGNVTSDGGAAVTARGVCWSTTSSPTTADNKTIDGTGTGTFTSTISGLTTNTTYYVRAYATNSVGTGYGNEITFTTLSAFSCGASITVNHVAGAVAPVDKTVTYGTVTNIPGEPSKCWITSNLGADHQATVVNDATEASAGWYWQFNRKQGYKHDGTTRTPNSSWITPISEDSDWQAANDPCFLELGSGWHVPTYNEWNNVLTTGGWTNWNGPWNSGLKLHVAGSLYYYSDGSLIYRGLYGTYWSSKQTDATSGRYLQFYSENSNMELTYKAFGFTVRCIRDATNTPPTTTVTGTLTATTCYNATETINVAGNGTSFIVNTGGSATMIAGQVIHYLPGTKVEPGGYMWGYIAPGGPWCVTPSMPAVVAIEEEPVPLISEKPSFRVYPNPTNGRFVLELTGVDQLETARIEIYGMQGEKILSKELINERKHEFSLSNKPVGVYFIRVISGNRAETVKIIKQ